MTRYWVSLFIDYYNRIDDIDELFILTVELFILTVGLYIFMLLF